MQSRSRRFRPRMLASLVAASLLLGCAGDTSHPLTAPLRAGLSVAAAGPEVPNVIRFQDQILFTIQDPETDLIAFAGLPDDPKQSPICGGDEPFGIADIQVAGIRQELDQLLIKGDPVNLHVYQRSTFQGPCVSSPIAVGEGRTMLVDTGGGADTWGFRMVGSVTLASGERAHLMAHNRFQILPGGTLERIFTMVRLN